MYRYSTKICNSHTNMKLKGGREEENPQHSENFIKKITKTLISETFNNCTTLIQSSNIKLVHLVHNALALKKNAAFTKGSLDIFHIIVLTKSLLTQQ